VPVSVWPAPCPVPGPGPEAAYVITAFSRPGELVVIPAGTGALLTAAAAAAAAGRQILGLFSGPAACHAAMSHLDHDLDPAARPLAQARAGGPGLLLQAGCPDAGRAALAITGDPRLRLPPASPRRCDGEEMDGLTSIRNSSASWRTRTAGT
jgi:hypothetical protein